MTPLELSFSVVGRPQPAGSKRAFAIKRGGVPTGRIAVTDDNANGKPWRDSIVAEALVQAHANAIEQFTGPLGLRVVFVLRRPKGHYGSGRRSTLLKPSAPIWPTVKPDATKLLRAVEDALSGVLWRDDAQVVAQYVVKRYGHPERAEISVREIPGGVAPFVLDPDAA